MQDFFYFRLISKIAECKKVRPFVHKSASTVAHSVQVFYFFFFFYHATYTDLDLE